MKKITIEVPEGYDLEETEEGWKLVKVDQEKKWEDFGVIRGWFVDYDSSIGSYTSMDAFADDRNLFPTEQEANAYGVVLPQLLQWRNKVNEGYVWNDDSKWCIVRQSNDIVVQKFQTLYHPLHFKTQEIAYKFLRDHKSLIEQLIIK